MAWRGRAGLGVARVVTQYGTPVPLVAFSEGHERAWLGRARRGSAGQGRARHGMAWVVSKSITKGAKCNIHWTFQRWTRASY